MKPLVKLNNNLVSELLEKLVDNTVKALDGEDFFDSDELVAVMPYGKLIGYFTKKLVEISDINEALRKSIALAHAVNFLTCIKQYNIDLKIDQKEFAYRANIAQANISNYQYNIESFNIDDFLNDDLVKLYSESFDSLFEDSLSIEEKAKIDKYRYNYLLYNFLQILEKRNNIFGKVNTMLNNDSYRELVQIGYRISYEEKLKNLYNETVLNDNTGMTLADIYVEPKFKVHNYCFKDSDKTVHVSDDSFVSISNHSIHKYIYDVFNGSLLDYPLRNNNSNLIFVLGYPGQGKSSLCKRILYDIFENNSLKTKQVFFIKIRNITDTISLLNNPIEVLFENWSSEYNADNLNITKNNFHNSIIILDGLDELFIRENLQKNAIDEFCKLMIRETENRPKIKVIITSRYGYVSTNTLKRTHSLIVQLKEFDEKQQLSWLSKYQEFHPETNLTHEKISLYNKEIAFKPIKELINQPILLHLIATISQDITKEMNRANIYDSVFTELIERSWASEGQIDNLKGLQKEDLREFIRDIAYIIFNSGREYIHKSKLIYLPENQRFINSLDSKSKLQDILKNIMIAFYFQETKKTKEDSFEEDRNDYAVEFLHKSLQEYLVAEKIWEKLLMMVDKDIRRNRYILDSKDCLEIVNEIFGKKNLPKEILTNIYEIINSNTKNDYHKKTNKELAERIKVFLPEWIIKGLVTEYTWGNGVYEDRERAIFFNLFQVICNLDNNTNYFEEKSMFFYLFRKTLSINLRSQKFTGLLKEQRLIKQKADPYLIDLHDSTLRINEFISGGNRGNFEFEFMTIHSTSIYLSANNLNGTFNNCVLNTFDINIISDSRCDFTETKSTESVFAAGNMHFKNCTFIRCIFYELDQKLFKNCHFSECVFYTESTTPKISNQESEIDNCAFLVPKIYEDGN